MPLCWLLLELGGAGGLWGAGPGRCWGLWVAALVFMEWHETARRQMWTTEPVVCANMKMKLRNAQRMVRMDTNVKQHDDGEEKGGRKG